MQSAFTGGARAESAVLTNRTPDSRVHDKVAEAGTVGPKSRRPSRP